MEWQLIQEFRRIPSEYQPDALAAIRLFTRLAKRPTYTIIDEDDETPSPRRGDRPSVQPEGQQGGVTAVKCGPEDSRGESAREEHT